MYLKQRRKEKSILVTGSSGLVGETLIRTLGKRKMKVVGCDIKNPSKENFIFEKCNLVSEKEVLRLFQKYSFTQVIHLAAYIKSGNLSPIERKKIFQANIVATFNLVAAMGENKIKRIIFPSSMTVYGLPQYLPVDENHPLNPLDFYGLSKVVAEEIIKNSNINYFIVRFPGIFAFNRKEGAIYNFISKALKEEDIHISAKSSTPWDVIFIEDVIKSIITSLPSEIENNIVNIGYGEPIELTTLAKKIVKLCNSHSKVIEDYSVTHPIFYLSTKKAENLLGFNPPSLDLRLHQFIDFFKHEK